MALESLSPAEKLVQTEKMRLQKEIDEAGEKITAKYFSGIKLDNMVEGLPPDLHDVMEEIKFDPNGIGANLYTMLVALDSPTVDQSLPAVQNFRKFLIDQDWLAVLGLERKKNSLE